MTRPLRLGALRLSLLATLASLLVAGLALALSGCGDSFAAPGVANSAQATEALALLPGDADVVGMVNLAAARDSDALEAALGGTGLGMVSGRGSEDFDAFVRMTGFSPAEDLDRVYLAATEGPGGGEGRAAFVAYGRFDRDRIARYIADQDEAGEVEQTEIDGYPVYFAAEDEGPRPGVAFVSDRMVLAGDEATLRAMIGRIGATDATADAELQALLDRVAYPDGAWFAARGLDRMGPGNGAAAQAAEGVVVSMAFEDGGVPVRAFVVTRPDASEDDVADLIRGGVSTAKMGMKDEPATLDVLDGVEVEAQDDGVAVQARLTSAFLASARD
jgi:hypothetical protein